MVNAVFPTPPSPSTTSLYNTIRPAILPLVVGEGPGGQRVLERMRRRRELAESGNVESIVVAKEERGDKLV